jgi:hypothetical protein
MQSTPLQLLEHYASSLGWMTVVGFLSTATWGVFKVGARCAGFINEIKAEWKTTRATILASKQLLDTVTTNHLAHIQDSSERTAQLLELQGQAFVKMVESINKLTTEVASLKSFLEAQALYQNRKE